MSIQSLADYIYYEEPAGVIYCGDCLDILPLLPDNSVDLVLTDPPYGVNYEYDGYQDTSDNLKALIDGAMPEMLRVSARILLTCGISNIFLYPKSSWILCWLNRAGANRNPWGFTC